MKEKRNMNSIPGFQPVPSLPTDPTPAQIEQLEREFAPLRDQHIEPGHVLIYESPGYVRGLQMHPDTSAWLIEQFETIADWHVRRQRPQLALHFQTCAETVRAVEAQCVADLN